LRHAQAVKIAASLAGQGLPADAIAAELRPLYPADVSDQELDGIARWSTQRGFTPCVPRYRPAPALKLRPAVKLAADAGAKMLARYGSAYGRTATLADFEAEFWERSDPRPPEDWRHDWRLLVATLYAADDRIGIKTGVDNLATIQNRDEWLRAADLNDTGRGLRICLNPVQCDAARLRNADVAAYRFLLLENDRVSLPEQAALLAAAPLPIVAVVTSGNRSLHAWLRLDAADEITWRTTAAALFDRFAPAGFDRQCATPSRLARLPGFVRNDSGGQQRLLYLTATPAPRGIIPL
jgi:hypothetical protein